MNNASENEIIFRCPACKTPLLISVNSDHFSCNACGFDIPVIEGIPLLVKDQAAVDRLIDDATKAGRAAWYEHPQIVQWQGPYRHHLEKRKLYVKSVLSSFSKRVSKPILGLDLGCGDGANIVYLAKHLSTLYASDYNLLRLIRASHVPGAKQVVMADVTDYPAIDNSFDLIFFNHVLEHISDDDKALSETYRILKPGGLVILGTPNEGALFWQLAYKLSPNSLATTDHVHFYTIGSLSRKCLQAGFVIQDAHPIGWGVPHWRLDSLIRRYKIVDDLLETFGRALLRSQATSLYLVLSK
jgi:SAM-dependent methyltransferase